MKTKKKTVKRPVIKKYGKPGHPTDYKPEYCQMMIDFFNIAPYKENRGKKIVAALPTLEKFAFNIGVSTDTIVNWTKSHKEFFGAYRKIKQLQKDILVTNGLLGNYNSNFAKFVACNFTDMKEKQEIEHTEKVKIEDIKKMMAENLKDDQADPEAEES